VSRWSNSHRLLLICVALGLGPLRLVGAQDTAILREGPHPVRGIPYLSPNTLPAFEGVYLLAWAGGRDATEKGSVGSEDVSAAMQFPEPLGVEVLYTREPLVLPAEWIPLRCGGLSFLRVTGEERYALCYCEEQAHTVFFCFPEEGATPLACRFAERFVRRFQVLLGFMEAMREPPFPAILQLGE
jgi:hypothetical protein